MEHEAGQHGHQEETEGTGEALDTREGAVGGLGGDAQPQVRLAQVATRLEEELLVGVASEVLQGAGLEGDLQADRATVHCHPVTVQEGPGPLGPQILNQHAGQVPIRYTKQFL